MFRPLTPIVALLALSASAQPRFVDRAAERGIEHVWGLHVFGNDLGGGIGIFDVDGDFDLDLLLASQDPAELIAYRNESGSFVDATLEWGLSGLTNVKQILFVDFDNDGRGELFLARWKLASTLLSWNGERFVDRSEGSGLTETITPERPGLATGATAGDLDRDGDLDLYLSYWKEGAMGPEAANRFYRNDGDLRFQELAAALGLDSPRKSYQAVFADLSSDGWPDLLVAQDKGGGLNYWQNDGLGVLVERTQESGLIGRESNTGSLIDGMGVAIGDYDGDLRMDVYVTNILNGNVLYRDEGDGSFSERAIPTGTLMQQTGWGTVFLDADQDGRLDLAVANFAAGDELFHNDGSGAFVPSATGALAEQYFSFALAAGDMDGDGDLDLVRSCLNGKSGLLLNETPRKGHWLQLGLQGSASNRDGIGVRVTLSAGGRSQLRERQAGSSYLCMSQPWLHFGVAESERVDLRIDWPSGVRDEYRDVEVDRLWIAREGRDLLLPQDLRNESRPMRLRILGNPARTRNGGTVRFALSPIAAGSTVELQLFDPRGRQLLSRSFAHGSGPEFRWAWEAADRDRDRLASGIYRVRVRVGSELLSGTVTLLR